jgi:hypothetical protein
MHPHWSPVGLCSASVSSAVPERAEPGPHCQGFCLYWNFSNAEKFWHTANINPFGFFRHLVHLLCDTCRLTICLDYIISYGDTPWRKRQTIEPQSFSTLNHEKTLANGKLAPGPRKPQLRSTTGLRRMTKPGIARNMGTGGGPAGELRTYQLRRGKRSCRSSRR